MQTLLLTIDALRHDHLPLYGYERDTIPALSELAHDSTVYTNAYANGVQTKVSIPSFLCSRYDGLLHVEKGPSIASVLSEAGVVTKAIHSNTVISNYFDRLAGFDQICEFEGYEHQIDRKPPISKRIIDGVVNYVPDSIRDQKVAKKLYWELLPSWLVHTPTPYVDAKIITDRSLSFVEDNRDDDFFLWTHFMEPHRPYGVTPGTSTYAPDIDEKDCLDLMRKAGLRPSQISANENDLLIDLYDSDINYLSRQLERLFDRLEEIGIWDELELIVTADHGEEFGEHGMYFHNNKPYDELIHVPLLHKEGVRRGGRVTEPKQLLDLGPTILQSHGVDIPDEFEGTLLTSPNGSIISPRLFMYEDEFAISVRTERWKYITSLGGNRELYDLKSDPGETQSVLEDNESTAADLHERIPDRLFDIDKWDKKRGEIRDRAMTVDSETHQRLKELGYLE